MTHPLDSSPADFYDLFSDIDGPELDAWRQAQSFAAEVRARIAQDWESAHYPTDLVALAGKQGLLTDAIDVPGQPTITPLASRLITMEVSRADASMATAIAVQAGLAMQAIDQCGSPEQREAWLGPLARAEKLGAFALTEPTHGSDAVALETTARKDGDSWVIDGKKKWIGNGHGGDITVVWARMEGGDNDGEVGGFLVPQDAPGYHSQAIAGKVALRAIPQAEIELDGVRVDESQRLPGATSFLAASKVLSGTRVGVAWSALGIAIDCFETALNRATERRQFGKPLASFQIIQQRLADMLQKLTAMALYCRRISQLEAEGRLRHQQASLAKVHNTRGARYIAAEARDLLGGTGILLENHVMRHMADIEARHTYEGTDSIQSLIIGKTITDISAYV